VIQRLTLTASDVCLRLVCFQSTSTFSSLEPRGIAQYALYKFTTYLLTYLLTYKQTQTDTTENSIILAMRMVKSFSRLCEYYFGEFFMKL